MFGVDITELMLVVVLGVILIGPKDMPKALYFLGKTVRKIKLIVADINNSVEVFMAESELKEISDKTENIINFESKNDDGTV